MKSNLEQFSHVVENIQLSWGTPRGRQYIVSLEIVEEGRTRQGFPQDVFSEIVLLLSVHDELWPEFKTHHTLEDKWSKLPTDDSTVTYETFTFEPCEFEHLRTPSVTNK